MASVLCLQTLSRLSCAYKKENQTKMVVCDLGNPMKGGTKVSEHSRAGAARAASQQNPNFLCLSRFWLS